MIPNFLRLWFLNVEIDYLRAYGMIKNERGTVPYIAERHARRRIRIEVQMQERMPPLGFPGTFVVPTLVAACACAAIALLGPFADAIDLPVAVYFLSGAVSVYLTFLTARFIQWSLPFVKATHQDRHDTYRTLLEKRLEERKQLK